MRALMNLAIEPALMLFEVSVVIATLPSRSSSRQAATRVLKVLAQTPQGAIRIARERYPRSSAHQVIAQLAWTGGSALA